jgi:hypothetical protein
MLRPLIIDETVKTRVREIVDFAASNHYYPGRSEVMPGDDPRHTVYLLSYRCVFSFTVDPEGELFRHLTVSVPGKKYPNPFAFFIIAELFGFTGWDGQSLKPPSDWQVGPHQVDRCVVAIQPVKPDGNGGQEKRLGG